MARWGSAAQVARTQFALAGALSEENGKTGRQFVRPSSVAEADATARRLEMGPLTAEIERFRGRPSAGASRIRARRSPDVVGSVLRFGRGPAFGRSAARSSVAARRPRLAPPAAEHRPDDVGLGACGGEGRPLTNEGQPTRASLGRRGGCIRHGRIRLGGRGVSDVGIRSSFGRTSRVAVERAARDPRPNLIDLARVEGHFNA